MQNQTLQSLKAWQQLRYAHNLMSITRIPVALLIIWFFERSGHELTWPIVVLVIYGIFSDYFDGYLARRRGQVSEFGKAVDPVSDKISSGMLFLYAVWIALIPVWYLLFIIVRDVIIMGASLYIRNLTGRMPSAIMSGKISINAVAAYWVAVFFAPDVLWLVEGFKWLSIALMIYSFGDYMMRYYRTYRKVKLS